MPIKLIQITDCHLLGDTGALYRGVNPFRTLQAVSTYIARRHGDADALLITGDLSQDESPASYRLLRDMLAPLGKPAYALPGNHDAPEPMHAAARDCFRLDRAPVFGRWQVLMARSNLPGRVEGALDDEELRWIERHLRSNGRPKLLAVHHPPVPVGSAWMDRIGMLNGADLLDLARRYPSLKAIVHGHTHQSSCVYDAGLPCYGTPSTWRQFVPDLDSPRMDSLPPALRVIELHESGNHASRVEFVQMPS